MSDAQGTLKCSMAGKCGGCSLAGQTLTEQRSNKAAAVAFLNENVRFRYTSGERLRDRADMIWENGNLGLYELKNPEDRTSPARILNLEACPMMSVKLEEFFKLFRQKIPPAVRKGSVRLRVGPNGERGVWLDFANADVKALFDEVEYLRWLSVLAFVEIGQRRKSLVWKDGKPKLVDPELKVWFETYAADGGAIPLYGPVGGFSQAGFAANRVLVDVVCEFAGQVGRTDWLELFCGNGNFAFALAARGYTVEAIEFDELALAGMTKTLEARPDLAGRVRFNRADVYLQDKKIPELNGRGLLVDPPRAGLRQVLKRIQSGDRPAALLYVSCHSESFIADSRELLALGYKVQALAGVDQFPHSNHSEWVALFTV